MLWNAITDESNVATVDIVRRPLDVRHRVREEDEFIFEYEPLEDEDEAEDLQSISPDEWGEEDYDWDEDADTDEDEK